MKSTFLHLRITPELKRRFEKAAGKQTVADWIREAGEMRANQVPTLAAELARAVRDGAATVDGYEVRDYAKALLDKLKLQK